MVLQIYTNQQSPFLSPINLLLPSPSYSLPPLLFLNNRHYNKKKTHHFHSSINGGFSRRKQAEEGILFGLNYPKAYNKRKYLNVVVSSSSASASASSSSSGGDVAATLWDTWSPDKASLSPSLSDILWPSLGAFAAMAMLGKMDQILARKGVSMTIAPLGAVCAVLFITPNSPAARKYNMFMAQIGCAAMGVVAFSIFGPGWLARSVALAASIAFMIYTRSTHPPAASLPLLFIDGAKWHHLNIWYALFPGAAGCILLSLIQEIVCYLKENVKF